MRAVQIQSLASYLQKHHPSDVLMPTKEPGEKNPKFSHRDGQWTWSSFNAKMKPKTDDLCILLKTLCVIDVDSVEQASALEERFPILREVPCELTKRGKHYFFARSPQADILGYYDGPAQRVKGIDFKRCVFCNEE